MRTITTAITVVSIECGSVFSVVGSDSWLVLVNGDVGGGVGGEVMTVSGGQVELLPQKVTSARCTQSESRERNRRPNVDIVFLTGKHTLTKESQEMMVLSTLTSNTLVLCSYV